MVHVPTRSDVPVRLGPQVQQIPDWPATTVPASAYNDPARFELERDRVLSQSWLVAGRSSEIPSAGDWLSFEGHGETVVVTRQPGGGLAAFHNVCQHRGPAFVVERAGCGARRFTCPYHGWVYDTTGTVVGVPEREDFHPYHLEGLAAPPVAADEWGGWVWVNLAGPNASESLATWIGPEILADLGHFRMEDMVLHEKLEFDVPVNYKAIVDGFNEVYHATQLHHTPPAFTKAARDTSFHFSGRNSMMFVPRPDVLEELWATLDHHRFAICHYVVFPNTTFNCNPDQIQLFNPVPVDVDRTRFVCWQLLQPGEAGEPEYDAYLRGALRRWEQLKVVVGEDIAIYEQLARTKRSSAHRRNVLSERECKIAKYHDTMDQMVADG